MSAEISMLLIVLVGAVVSTVITRAEDVAVPPAGPVSVTVILHSPSGESAPSVQLPEDSVQVTFVAPALLAVTTPVPAKLPETVIVGVLSLVTLSVLEVPESDAVRRSGVVGVGTVVVKVMVDTVDELSAVSLTITYALYAVPAISPVTFEVFAAANAAADDFVTAVPCAAIVAASGASSAEA